MTKVLGAHKNLTEKKGYAKVFERILWECLRRSGKTRKMGGRKLGGEMLWFGQSGILIPGWIEVR